MDFRLDGLGSLTDDEVLKQIIVLPHDINKLDISKNELYRKSSLSLSRALKKIPKQITILDMSQNALYRKSGNDLGFFFSSVALSINHLILKANDFSLQSATEFARALAMLPKPIVILDISDNALGNKTTDELIKIFSSIPTSIKTLYFCNNELAKKPANELIYLLKHIPKHITQIDLSGNNLGHSVEEIVALFNKLPEHVTQVALEPGKFISKCAFAVAAPILMKISFEKHVNIVAAKASELQSNNNQAAAVAHQLLQQLHQAKQAFYQGNINQKLFSSACLSAINQAKPILEQCGSWSVLANFKHTIVSVLTLGIANLVTRKLGFFQNTIVPGIHDLEQAITHANGTTTGIT